MKRLLKLQGEKLPQEKVWVDADGMYEVYDRIDINIQDIDVHTFIITDITIEGLMVDTLH